MIIQMMNQDCGREGKGLERIAMVLLLLAACMTHLMSINFISKLCD